jgi:hypothetical protein
MSDQAVVKRNMDLVALVTRFIFKHPHMLDRLPPDFRLVVLSEDDRGLCQYNLELLAEQENQEKPVVIVRVKAHQADLESSAQVYVPLAA